MSKVKVYIAGPLSGNVVGNIRNATEVAEKLIRNGYSVLCPHLSAFMWYHRTGSRYIEPRQDACGLTHGQWLANDLPWVEAADVVLRLPGKSPGADIECNHAEKHGIHVDHSMDDLPDPEGVDGDEVVTTKVRYFTVIDDLYIVRTRLGALSRCYFNDNGKCKVLRKFPREFDFEWWDKAVRNINIFREVTEAEAAAILGGKPWEDKK